jgi:2-polyprenyl-3-methyl-5-hydroxy-6-metoxy-1,4-benzoquinol methylase
MIQKINTRLLKDITVHTRKLGIGRILRCTGYERSGELPLIASRLESLYKKKLNYLDIGSGDSVFPTYILKRTNWDVTCIDKFSSVQKQNTYASRAMNTFDHENRFHVIEHDFLDIQLQPESFDVITSISVIEHFEENKDSLAMEKSGELLRPGGVYILTTLINDGYFREFFLKNDVYGEEYSKKPIFYQRHYDVKSFDKNIIEPSGLLEKERIYFGEYGLRFGESLMYLRWPWKPIKIIYQWATPFFSRRFLTYRDYPISRKNISMCTTSGVFVVLTKMAKKCVE